MNKTQRIKKVLDHHLFTLTTNYKGVLYQEEIVVKNTLEFIYRTSLDLLEKLPNTTKVEQDRLREELYKRLSLHYAQIKENGVYQFQIVLPDNTTFLRMHKKDIHGDNLEGIRYGIEYTN